MAKLKGGARNLPASHSLTNAPMAGPNSAPVKTEGGALIRHLKGLEDEVAYFNRSTERLYVFNKDGSLAFSESQHEAGGVGLDVNQLSGLSDKILLHNHPSGNAFSLADVMTSREYNIFEMRATGKFGTFILRRPKEGWPNETIIRRELMSHMNGLSPQISDTTLNAWGDFAKSIGSDFVFVPRQLY